MPDTDLQAALAAIVEGLAPHAEALASAHYIEIQIHTDGHVVAVEAPWLPALLTTIRNA